MLVDDSKEKLSDYDGEDAPLVHQYPKRRASMQRLAEFSLTKYLTDDYERLNVDPKVIAYTLDLKNIAAYVLAIQVIGACLVTTGVSIAVPYLLPPAGKNSVRNLVACAIVATSLLSQPLLTINPGQMHRMGPPLKYVFRSLRNCAGCLLGSWAIEALLYSDCALNDGHEILALRHAVLVLAFLGIVVASCFRVAFPTSVSDVHVTAALLFATVLVCAPQSQHHSHNPLSRQLSFAEGLVRAIRVTLFSTSFTACVLAAAPLRIFELEPLVLTTRAFAATLWILACPPPLLFAQPLFLCALCMRRVRSESPGSGAPIVVPGVYAEEADYEGEQGDTVKSALPSKTTAPTPIPTTTTTTTTLSEERKRVLLSRLSGT